MKNFILVFVSLVSCAPQLTRQWSVVEGRTFAHDRVHCQAEAKRNKRPAGYYTNDGIDAPYYYPGQEERLVEVCLRAFGYVPEPVRDER